MHSDPRPTRSPLVWTLTVAAVTGFCSLGLVHYLAQTVAKPVRIAGMIVEPEVTGSITPALAPSVANGARSVVLDPCTGRERLVVRGP